MNDIAKIQYNLQGIEDENNTSFKTTAGTQFIGEWTNVLAYSHINVIYKTDETFILTIQYSTDAINVDYEIVNPTSTSGLFGFPVYSKFYRVKFENDSFSSETFLRIQSTLHKHKNTYSTTLAIPSTTGIATISNQLINHTKLDNIYTQLNDNYSPYMKLAIREIFYKYADTVTISPTSLLKFARSDNINGTFGLVWMTPTLEEVLPTANTIDTIVSDNAGDTQLVVIIGNTINAGVVSYSQQTATLSGLSPVVLGTPLYRVHKIYNDSSIDFLGEITIYDSTSGLTHITASGDRNQSEKCTATTINGQYAIITSLVGSVLTKATANVEFNFQIKEFGKVWKTVYQFGVANYSSTEIGLEPHYIIPPRTDARIMAKSTSNNTEVSAGCNVIFANV